MYDGIEYRGAAHGAIEELVAYAGVPVYDGLTDDWHPTQMLADFLTMCEASHKPPAAIAHCHMGDARSNTGRSLLVMGAIKGADVRICGPRELWPPADVQALAAERAQQTGARITLIDDPSEALPGAEFVPTDVWVSRPAIPARSSCTACRRSTTRARRWAARSWTRRAWTTGSR